MKKRNVFAILLSMMLIFSAVVLATQGGSNIIKDVRLIGKVITQTYENYVDPIDTHKFILSGIKGLMSGLDFHTVYFEPKDYEDLKTSTRGEFGGLGIIIGMRDNILTIISPMEGTPAYRMGLTAGDKIVMIDGEPTKGMNTEDAVDVLRGEPGTEVTITIVRVGAPDPMDYTIVRDIIHIDAVPFAGMIDDEIGYIRLARFSEEAGAEVRAAVDSLKSLGMRDLVFDLRSNSGGLLSQAVEVASVFLEPSELVVYTQGREERSRRNFFSRWGNAFDEGKLIVLQNGGSASASEIVAGAIQDHDRGIIYGTLSFGKGLVQSVIPLSEDGDALKITTAKYYIPSGRCIQKEDYLDRPESVVLRPELSEEEKAEKKEAVGDRWWEHDVITEDDLASDSIPKDAPIYYTDKGRKVYGGGGISPDVFFEPERLSRFEIELERRNMFFAFTVDYLAENDEFPPDFKVDDNLYRQFVDYVLARDFEYKTLLEVRLEEAQEAAEEMGYNSEIYEHFDIIHVMIEQEKVKDFERKRDYIERGLRREFVTQVWGEKANYQYVIFDTDPAIARAVELIRNEREYFALLSPSDD
ncbi:MAG TPA: S41 family peptidase [candidate division Zixibacteria bacterium]|nr:S41 family peptidase [candidate division Zixibacteria bacterium]